MSALQALIAGYAQAGRLEGIWLRSERLVTPVSVSQVDIDTAGLVGDHGRPGKRAVTLIQAEHLSVIGAMLGRGAIGADVLRRNLVVSGLNLNALKGRHVQIGEAVLEITTLCAPCSRMETALGKGGYSAVRGHGGWCASVVRVGRLHIGAQITPVDHDGQ